MRNAVTCFVLSSLFCLAPVAAVAGPTIMMDDPTTGTIVSGNTFGFNANESGGGFLSFLNGSGNIWRAISIDVLQPSNTVIHCSGGPFYQSCAISSQDLGNGTTVYSLNFNARSKTGGIQNQESFEVNLNDPTNMLQPPDPNGAGSWGSGVSFSAEVTEQVTATPEPGSSYLLFAALAAGFVLAVFRRTLKIS